MAIIRLTQGDDSNALGEEINIILDSDLDLTGYSAVFQLCDFQYKWEDITSKKLPLIISSEDSKKLESGMQKGALKIYDKDGLAKTVIRDIQFLIELEVVEDVE